MARPRFEVPVSLDPDPVIEAYKPGIDFTLVAENLRLSVDERVRKLQAFVDGLDEVRASAKERRERAIRDSAPGSR